MKTRKLLTFALLCSLSFALAGPLRAAEKSEDTDSDDEAQIEKVTLARDNGEKFEPVKSFKPTDIFAVIVQLTEVKTATKVKGVWTIVDAGGMKDKKLLEKEVTISPETNKKVEAKNRVDFSLTHDNPYPAGDYKMEVYLNDELAETVEFKIE